MVEQNGPGTLTVMSKTVIWLKGLAFSAFKKSPRLAYPVAHFEASVAMLVQNRQSTKSSSEFG
jgi:hypothetical protein